ncbi:MAG: glutaminase A [Rhizobiaceae bacterium]|nr:glutaminase A [Rhizobiaceae bacterium]MCV0405083.1 glutaminase A [Rhizobiaceae bacterium]
MAKAKDRGEPVRLKDVVDDIVAQIDVIARFGQSTGRLDAMKDVEFGRFGIAVATVGGEVVTGGAAETPIPIQSIFKVFSLTLALRAFGDEIWKRVGREPSGDPFNSIIDLERMKGIPRNPFINAGALVICDIVLDRDQKQREFATVRDFLEHQIGEKKLGRVEEIVKQDGETSGFQNRALANLAKGFGNLHHEVEDVMKLYAEQCAIELTVRQLALAGRYLIHDGDDAGGEDSSPHARISRRVNAIMLTCGQYDGSGDFAFRVGLPAKSGVSGAILAIVPDVASVAVWSPGLDDNGNSLLGTLALERLTEEMGWSVFG